MLIKRSCNLQSSRLAWKHSGGASARKEPGHFEVRKLSSRSPIVRGVALFFCKKVNDLFSRRPQNTGCQRRWLLHCQNKTNKAVRYCNILFIFCSDYYRSKALVNISLLFVFLHSTIICVLFFFVLFFFLCLICVVYSVYFCVLLEV